MTDQLRKKKSQGENQNHLKKMKEKAMTSNDAELLRDAKKESDAALAKLTEDMAAKIKEEADNAFAIGVSRGQAIGYQNGYEQGKKKAKHENLISGMLLGGTAVLIASFLAIHFSRFF